MKYFPLKLSVTFLLALVFISQQVEAKSKEIIWSKKSKINYQGFTILKKCIGNEDFDNNCQVKIVKNKKVLARFDSQKDYWVKFSLFNFLGGNDKQLIIHTYSGGAHCCNDYVIYDLKPTFRKVYDSTKFDSGSEIGNYLTPIDIDKDGVFEFQRSVMKFDYFHTSHASSVFPPVIFRYNKKKGLYDFANKVFPNFVLKEMGKISAKISNNNNLELNSSYNDLLWRVKFFYLVYSGKEKEAWEYFEENCNYPNKEEYQKDVIKIFKEDPTYLSIYRK